MITKDNFYTQTKAVFTKCDIPVTEPDYISLSSVTGKVSSSYWYTEKGVIRVSNHWGGIASCMWTLKGISKEYNNCEVYDKEYAGYASFEDIDNTTNEFEILNSKKMSVLSGEYFKLPEDNQSFAAASRTEKGIEAMNEFNKRIHKLFKL